RFRAAFLAGETLNMDVRIDLGGGRTRVVHVDAEPAQEPGANSVQTFIGSIQDITERRQAEERISRLAYFDALTGLPNRQHFRERLGRAIHKARVDGGQVALLLLDLDNFKLINDSLGHSAGDELLREVTHRLSRRLRHADPVDFPREEQGAMSRLGGDEFTVIISDLRGQADA
ncbi:MAG: diguanylate cyclase, partial [Rhodocyclaceae bacterium]|nr:diguanylate cyclase [Rhodocyclaceae bacterium]